MSSVTLNTVLRNYQANRAICEFLQEAQLSRVSKNFRTVNTEKMTRVGRRIVFEDFVSNEMTHARARVLCSEEERTTKFLSMFYQAIEVIAASSLGDVAKNGSWTQLEKLLPVYWRHLNISQKSAGNCADRLILFLDRVPEFSEERLDQPRSSGKENTLDRLFNDLKKLLVRENLALHCHEAVRGRRFAGSAADFSALSRSQKEKTAHSVIQRQLFEELRGPSFALERLEAREELVMDAEIDHESALEQAWGQIWHGAIRGPDANARASEIRAWMDDTTQHRSLVEHDLSDLRTADLRLILADLRLVHAWLSENGFQNLPKPLGALVLDYCHHESVSAGVRFDYAKIATIFQNAYGRSFL